MAGDQDSQHEDTMQRDAEAPAPDHPMKPDSPTEITKPSWRHIFKRSLHEFTTDECTDLAAALTYFAVLSAFPALLAVLSLLGVVGQGEATAAWMIGFLTTNAPADLVGLLADPIRQLATQGGSGLALVTGVVGAIWAASGYVGAFARAMNRVYDVTEGRPFWKLRPMQVIVTVIILGLVIGVLVLFLLSGPLGEAAVGRDIADLLGFVAWPAAAVAGLVILAVLYYATPNVQQPRFRWISVGAVVAFVGMAVASVGFTFYVSNFSKYNAMYGTVGSVIVLLLGLWIMNTVMLFGAELDAELERGRQLQAGIEAEEVLQLPPRDARGSAKGQAKQDEMVQRGRELREKSAAAAEEGEEHKGPDAAASVPASVSATGARDWYADASVRGQLGMRDAGAADSSGQAASARESGRPRAMVPRSLTS